MRAICYNNTKTTIPNWVNTLHLSQQLGYAYELDDYFVHFYGRNKGLYIVSPGLTAIERKKENITLEEWAKCSFGAENIKTMKTEPGYVQKCSWRPGIVERGEFEETLDFNDFERNDMEQALMILIKALTELFNYIEPDKQSLKVYSHKIRELLILACTEFENQCVCILKKRSINSQGNYYTTLDYVKLIEYCHLKEYVVQFGRYNDLEKIKPFNTWENSQPTKSLSWYDAYNQTKHSRSTNFKEATFENLLYAISANIVMYCVRFGPMYLYNNMPSLFSTMMAQYINLEFSNPDVTSFYLPRLKLDRDKIRGDFCCFDSKKANLYENWIIL